MTGPRIAVIGAGIGGLTTALALRHVGLDCEVYEAATELREVGAGVQIGPNASRLLYHLGLAEPIDAAAVRPVTGDLRRWDDGSIITRQPLGDEVAEQFGFPYLHLHRVDLHNTLLRAWGPDRVATGHRCTGVEQSGPTATVTFENGHSAAADVVVGADGVHSAVRTALHGPEQARFSGAAAWRGLVPVETVAHLDLPVVSTATLGPGQHFVHYYVSAGRFVNWVGVAPTDDWRVESWTAEGRIDEALADYEGWNHTVRGLIEAMRGSTIYRWGMYDRDPLPVWGEDGVTLLGDACHPMLPYMAQGAAQAIEDAVVLAGALSTIDDPHTALRRYEDLRRDRTAAVQLAARTNEQQFHLPDGSEQRARDERLGAQSGSGATHRNAWVFDYDAVAVGRSAAEGA